MFDYTQKDIERFYSKIDTIDDGPDKGCWDIDYHRNRNGYTHFSIGSHNKRMESHRFMYQIHHPEENMDGLQMYHTCNNNWCVNPDHIQHKKPKTRIPRDISIYTQEDIERFYSRINIIDDGHHKGCWDINYARGEDGYTQFSLNNHTTISHRFMYYIHHPGEDMFGLDVCHKCDHPWCVNPDHLWLDTRQANIQDMVSKDRQAKGSKNGKSILTEDLIKEILDNILNGSLVKRLEIAKKYQVRRVNIDYIINKGWSHVTKHYDMNKIKKILNENCYYFSHQDVRDIRARLKTGESQINIAKDYNTYYKKINNIKLGKTYTNVI